MSAQYQFLDQQENVKVKVPRESQYMEFVPAHKFEAGNGNIVSVEDHWRSSSNINGQIVQRNFFGITEEQLGKNVIGLAEVQMKTTSSGKKVLLINFWPNIEKQRAEYKMGFETSENGILQLCFDEINQPAKFVAAHSFMSSFVF
ncbi:MAG: hypothetical protein U5L10_02200 [Candidatus Moranbacteria bacterium]|nr:hypothetical protein [Candidatus Moranbacteria bacterium]